MYPPFASTGGQTPRQQALAAGSPNENPKVSQLLSQLGTLTDDHQSLVKVSGSGVGSEGAQGQTFLTVGMPQSTGGIQGAAPAPGGWLVPFLCYWLNYLLGVVMFAKSHQNSSERDASAEPEIPLGMSTSVGHDNIDTGTIEDCGNVTYNGYTDAEGEGEHAEEGDFPQPGPLIGMTTRAGDRNRGSGNIKGCGNITRNRFRNRKP